MSASATIADLPLRRASASSPHDPSPFCTSTNRGLTAPRAELTTRLSDFATHVMNNAG
jgi:hypothetical protein